jgi:hypothetical protein
LLLKPKINYMSAEIIDLNVGNEQPVAETTPASKFDPNKNYSWQVDSQFTLTGAEFGVILNALRAILGTQEAQALFLAQEAHNKFEEAFARSVEAGIAVEANK